MTSFFSHKKYEYNVHDDLKELAQDELGEDPDHVMDDIEDFRKAVTAITCLHSRTDDSFLLSFLRARKFNKEKALAMVKRYYEVKKRNPSAYRVALEADIRHVYQLNAHMVLPDRDSHGRPVIFLRSGYLDPSIVSSEDLLKVGYSVLEYLVQDQAAQITGVVAVNDFNNLSWSHTQYFTRTVIQTVISVLKDSFPLRYKAFHIVNEPRFVQPLYSILRPLLPQKIKDRLFFHGRNYASLHMHLPPEILPEEYGGLKPKFDNSEWWSIMKDHDGMFGELLTYGFKS